MDRVMLGAVVGVTLAGLNFLVSTWISSKVKFPAKFTSVAVILAGFIGRLGALGLLFYGLSRVQEVHFQTALLTFAGAFTACLAIKTTRFYRRVKSLTPDM